MKYDLPMRDLLTRVIQPYSKITFLLSIFIRPFVIYIPGPIKVYDHAMMWGAPSIMPMVNRLSSESELAETRHALPRVFRKGVEVWTEIKFLSHSI